MPYEEKTTWIYAVTNLVIPVAYFAIILGQLPSTDAAQIAYQVPLLSAIGVSIVLSIVANIAAGIFSPKTASTADERDKQIARLGVTVGFIVFSILVALPLGLALAEAPHFWIANAIYLSYALTALVYSIVKIVAYRRGL